MTDTNDPALAAKVLTLRRAGVQFDVIADRLQVTPETARALFDTALASHDPEFERTLEADRLDRLHATLWPEAVAGNKDAIDRVLRISERRERLASQPGENDHALRTAFDRSTMTSDDINGDVDAALVEAGRKIADRVDAAVATGEGQEVTKALYLVPHMVNVLREMLATPASRQAAKAAAPVLPKEGKLAQLRAIQGAKQTG